MLKTGTTVEVHTVVGERDIADIIAISPEDRFPGAWATSRMIAPLDRPWCRCWEMASSPWA
jgi:hypothetical protein